jgi:hypothetical protein
MLGQLLNSHDSASWTKCIYMSLLMLDNLRKKCVTDDIGKLAFIAAVITNFAFCFSFPSMSYSWLSQFRILDGKLSPELSNKF